MGCRYHVAGWYFTDRRPHVAGHGLMGFDQHLAGRDLVRFGSWMGPPQGERAPRVGRIRITTLSLQIESSAMASMAFTPCER